MEKVLDDFVEFSSSYVPQMHDGEIWRLRKTPEDLSDSPLAGIICPMALAYHEEEIF